MTSEQALHDLTLALIYLTRVSEKQNGSDLWDVKPFQAWKNYDWDTVDKLDEEGLVSSKHRNKSLWLTEDGVKAAREILNQLGIEDWEQKEISKAVKEHLERKNKTE